MCCVKSKLFKTIIAIISVFVLSANLGFMTVCNAEQQTSSEGTTATRVEQILTEMTLDEKISQMIIPAIRTWNQENVTDLSRVPELAEALRAHQYGGVILFGGNVSNTEQLAKLVSDLQVNNAQNENVFERIPYFLPLDEEGGIVTPSIYGNPYDRKYGDWRDRNKRGRQCV